MLEMPSCFYTNTEHNVYAVADVNKTDMGLEVSSIWICMLHRAHIQPLANLKLPTVCLQCMLEVSSHTERAD